MRNANFAYRGRVIIHPRMLGGRLLKAMARENLRSISQVQHVEMPSNSLGSDGPVICI